MLDWLVDRECMTVCLVLTLTLFFAVHAGAMGSSPKVSPTVGQKQDSSVEKFASDPRVKQPEALRKAFDQHGTARLIINIDPPGAMAGYDRQEDRVKAALDRFINSLSAQTQKAVIRRFSTIYAFVVKVTPEQLGELLNQQDVNSVEQDALARPLSKPSSLQ